MRAYVLVAMMGLMPPACEKLLGQKPAASQDTSVDLPPVIPTTTVTAPPTYVPPDPGGPPPSTSSTVPATPPETVKARAAAAANDSKTVKKVLFDKVKAGKGSVEEVGLLKDACTQLKDKACLAMLKKQDAQ